VDDIRDQAVSAGAVVNTNLPSDPAVKVNPNKTLFDGNKREYGGKHSCGSL
jgi:hypothetical protein